MSLSKNGARSFQDLFKICLLFNVNLKQFIYFSTNYSIKSILLTKIYNLMLKYVKYFSNFLILSKISSKFWSNYKLYKCINLSFFIKFN